MSIEQLGSAHRRPARVLGLAMIAVLAAACKSATAPRETGPVAFQLAANARFGTSASVAGLEITGVRMVVGAVALGNGDEFGCRDCQGDKEEAATPPQLIDVPLDGGSVLVSTEQVNVGTYGLAEFSVEQLSAPPTGDSWAPGTTILITGRYNGTAFQLPLSVDGSFRETLSPPAVVTGSTPESVQVRITLPVASWFVLNGTTLDPTLAANRVLIESNVRASLQSDDGESRGERESEGGR